MEISMGRVLTQVTIENLGDLVEVERGTRSPADVRRATVADALVDTGATTLALPTSLIRELGLKKVYEKRATSTRGIGPVSVYEAVRLTIAERFCSVDVMEVPDGVPVLIGQIPLEMLDLVVDLPGRRLTGNPAHNGEHVLELFQNRTDRRVAKRSGRNMGGRKKRKLRFPPPHSRPPDRGATKTCRTLLPSTPAPGLRYNWECVQQNERT